MQTFVNILALSSFAVSATVVAAGAYVYVNKDLIIERAKERVLGELMPEMPIAPDFVPDIEEPLLVDDKISSVPGLS